MKKYALLIICCSLFLSAGALLCGFADRLRSMLYYNYTPTGIALMISGFLGLIFCFVDYVVDKIKNNNDKK